MKKFTMIILAIGVLTLIFYALNPVEEFELNTGGLDFEELIRKYTSLTPEQQQAIKDKTDLLRQQTGIATGESGASNPYEDQPIDTDLSGNPIDASYPGTPSNPLSPTVQTTPKLVSNMNRFRGEFTGQFIPALSLQQQTDQVINSSKTLPSIMRNTTPASMLQAKKDDKNASTIMSPEPDSCGAQPVKNNSNYNDILKAQISAKEAQDAKATSSAQEEAITSTSRATGNARNAESRNF